MDRNDGLVICDIVGVRVASFNDDQLVRMELGARPHLALKAMVKIAFPKQLDNAACSPSGLLKHPFIGKFLI